MTTTCKDVDGGLPASSIAAVEARFWEAIYSDILEILSDICFRIYWDSFRINWEYVRIYPLLGSHIFGYVGKPGIT